jgi:hypothetical protein
LDLGPRWPFVQASSGFFRLAIGKKFWGEAPGPGPWLGFWGGPNRRPLGGPGARLGNGLGGIKRLLGFESPGGAIWGVRGAVLGGGEVGILAKRSGKSPGGFFSKGIRGYNEGQGKVNKILRFC